MALWFTHSSHRELLTRALRTHVERLDGVILDVGGGRRSPLAEHWPARAHRLRLDISARFDPDVQGDAQRLPVRTGSVDGVVISEVLEHVPEPALALAELRRVLRPGAPVLCSVPFAIGIHADPHDHYRYTDESLRRLFADFDAVRVAPHGNHLGAAWRAVNERWHWLWLLNPLVRPLGRRTDERWPVGYTVTARRAVAPHP